MKDLKEVVIKYSVLQDLSPKHALLKYIVMDRKNPKPHPDIEQIFGIGFPKFKDMRGITRHEYNEQFANFMMDNYETALDNEILRITWGIKRKR